MFYRFLKFEFLFLDGDFDGRRTYANLTIDIQDVNDDPPIFKPVSPTSTETLELIVVIIYRFTWILNLAKCRDIQY